MSWSLSCGPVAQGGVRDELEAAQDEVRQSFSDEVRDQQNAVFAAVETVVDKAKFGGAEVSVTAAGHVEAGQNFVSLTVSEANG